MVQHDSGLAMSLTLTLTLTLGCAARQRARHVLRQPDRRNPQPPHPQRRSARTSYFEPPTRRLALDLLKSTNAGYIGGNGHVPIPLLKQPESTNNMLPIPKRRHFVS